MKLFKILKIKNLSIYQLTLFLLVVSSIISIAIVAASWAYIESRRVHKEINGLEEKAIEKQKENLKTVVSQLTYYLEFAQRDTINHSLDQLKEEALIYFESIRFGNDGYVFVNTCDGFALLFDGQIMEEPRNITDLTDPDGFRIFDKELELAKLEEGGAFRYLFKKIYTTKALPKLSYVNSFDNWGWIVGVGDYLDSIDTEITSLEKDLKSNLYRGILIAFGIFIPVLILLLYISSFVAKSIQNQFNKFVRIIKQTDLSKKDKRPLDLIFIRELKEIASNIAQAEVRVNQLGHIIEQSQNEIYIFNQDDLNFVLVNSGARKNCGYAKKELIKMTPLDLKPKLNKTQFLDIIEPLKQNKKEQIHFETVHQRKDKSFYPVDVHLAKSVFNEKSVYVAFIYDISIRKEAEKQMLISTQRFLEVFDNAPIALWEEDFSELIEYLDNQMEIHKMDAEQLLDKHQDVLVKCSKIVRVLNVNKQTLKLYEATSEENLIGNLSAVFTEDSFQVFKAGLIALVNGEDYFEAEGINKTLTGKEINVLLRWSFIPTTDRKQQKVIVSVVSLDELRLTEKELLAAKTKMESIFLAAPTGIGVVAERVFTELNDRICEMTGYTEEELLGKQSCMLYPSQEEFERVGKEKYEQIKKSGTGTVETLFKRKDGQIIDVLLSSTPIDTTDLSKGVTFTALDITERKNMEKSLNHSHNLMRYIVDHNQSDVAVHDKELKYLYVSQSYLKHYKVKDQNVIGKHHYDVFPDLPQKWRDVHQKALAGEVLGADNDSYIREDGTVEWTRWECRPWYEADGSIGGIIVYTEVITEQKQIEEELKKHRNQLEELVNERTAALEESQNALLNLVDDMNIQSAKVEKSNKQLAEINEELETFTYSVSHDLKAPLRGIDGYSQLLAESASEILDDDSKKFLTNIRSSTQQMNLLIEDLLAYSRLERSGFIHEPIKLSRIIEDVLTQYQAEIEMNAIEIVQTFPKDYIIVTDKESLLMVMRNLIDNAIKFSAKEKKAHIEIGSIQSSTESIIFVKDNGVGFDMKYHNRIFKIFQRLHLAEEYQGTGIGLAMVSKAVQRMNGNISAESSPGNGACFTLKLGNS